jgi:hypothetical protein
MHSNQKKTGMFGEKTSTLVQIELIYYHCQRYQRYQPNCATSILFSEQTISLGIYPREETKEKRGLCINP